MDSLLQVFSEVLGVQASELSDETSPENTEEWDSLAAMSLVTAIENRYDIKISIGEIMSMNSIGNARAILSQKGVAFEAGFE